MTGNEKIAILIDTILKVAFLVVIANVHGSSVYGQCFEIHWSLLVTVARIL
jgi:hypothetical protein